jgi:hypothetical protein
MPRQNFLSRESFVEATETQAKESLLSIPVFASNIKFVTENTVLQSFRFWYQFPEKKMEYQVDVTLRPLNNEFTRICLHGTHCNGHAFNNDADMSVALHDFESAFHAALKGDASIYKPYKPKEKNSRGLFQGIASVAASLGLFFLRKKLS